MVFYRSTSTTLPGHSEYYHFGQSVRGRIVNIFPFTTLISSTTVAAGGIAWLLVGASFGSLLTLTVLQPITRALSIALTGQTLAPLGPIKVDYPIDGTVSGGLVTLSMPDWMSPSMADFCVIEVQE